MTYSDFTERACYRMREDQARARVRWLLCLAWPAALAAAYLIAK